MCIRDRSNAGVITATSFSGPVVAGAGVSNVTAGIGTYTDLRVGGNTTFSEDLVVTGNARVTGILTVGTSSIILNDSANTIKVGTALTLGHTQGLQFHTQNLHSAGFDVNQINVSGASTIGGNLDANGDLDVDGHTNLDNVSISGVTTASTINSTGNIEIDVDNGEFRCGANGDFKISHNGSLNILRSDFPTVFRNAANNETLASLTPNGSVALYHDNFKRLETSSVGVSIPQDLDVDGHTNLDNVNVVGVLTVTGAVNASHSSFGNLTALGINVSNTNATINFTDTNNNPDFTVTVDSGEFLLKQTNSTDVLKVNTDAHIDVLTNCDFASGIDVTGNATFSGNVSIGGTLTYEDVTNIDSVGIVTARLGVFIPDDNTLKFGNTSASPDLKIEHVSSGTYNRLHASNGYMQYRASAHYFNDEGSSINFIRCENNRVDLRYNGSAKLTTEASGVNITGVCTATSFVGDGSNITALNGSNIASGTVPVARIGTGTKNSSTFYRGDGTFATVTAPAITAISNPTNDRIVTSEGGTTVNAEGNLTFNGSKLNVAANDGGTDVNFAVRNTNANGYGAYISGGSGSSRYILRLDDNSQSEKFRFKSDGNMTATGTVDGGGGLIGNSRFFGAGGNANSTVIKSNASGAVALTLQDSGGNHKLELYGEGTNQGFLASAWGQWDLRKVVDGELILKVSGTFKNAIHQGNVSGNVGLQNIAVFTSNGTWTKPSGITRIKVYVTGGGGGGGSHNGDDANGGGGAGATAIEVIDVTSVSSVSVTIGTGGGGSSGNTPSGAGNGNASSFGSYCTGGGGEGPNNWGIGGSGGVASGGDLNLRGGYGTSGNIDGYGNSEAGGSGGTSFWGGGPNGGTHWGSRGTNGPYGAGGAGAHANTNNNGSDGQPGVVVIELYKS